MFRPYKSRRAFEDIAGEIKQAILSESFNSGDRLPSERELAEQFQVGRVTIREAFRTLEAAGLIHIKKGSRGAFVAGADPDAMAAMIMDRLQLEGTTHDQMIEARTGIECANIKAVISHGTDDDLDCLRQDIEVTKEVLPPDHSKEIVARMIRFHILLAETSHNIPYIMFIRSMMEWASRMLIHWVPSASEQRYSAKSHEEIYKAIKARDVALSQHLIKEHIEQMGALVWEQSEALK